MTNRLKTPKFFKRSEILKKTESNLLSLQGEKLYELKDEEMERQLGYEKDHQLYSAMDHSLHDWIGRSQQSNFGTIFIFGFHIYIYSFFYSVIGIIF